MLTIGQPGAHWDATARESAFTVRVFGCSASSATIKATAEGLVNGERRSIELQPVRVPGGSDTVEFQPGTRRIANWPSFTMAIPKAWPTQGTWIVKVEASTGWGAMERALVVVGPDGVDRARTRTKPHFTESEIAAMLGAAAPSGL